MHAEVDNTTCAVVMSGVWEQEVSWSYVSGLKGDLDAARRVETIGRRETGKREAVLAFKRLDQVFMYSRTGCA